MENQATINDLQVSLMRLSEDCEKWKNLAKSLAHLIVPFSSLLTFDEKEMLMEVLKDTNGK